jgi:DNA repair exonuclease SbcCD ATPase subunit
VHPADQMDLHKQTGEMVFHTLSHASASVAKLQVSLNNAQTQLKLEKISSFVKDNRIKTLEEMVLKIGYDPSNVKAAEEMINKKNANIASLRKQLKLPPIEDSHSKEIAEKEGEKDEMLKLLMEQNAQLKEMEAEMERLLKEKEQMKPMEVIPLSSILISGASTTTVTTIPSATLVTPQEGTTDLTKSMEKVNLQETEINRLKKEVENLHELKTSFQTSLSKEKQVTEKLKKELQQLQKKIVAGKTLAEVKENVWIDITKSINKIWPMIQIMFEHNELVQRSKQAIEKIRVELGDRPTQANDIIKFLNSKTREELEELKIEDRTETILEVKRVLTKRGLMLQLEEKVQTMDLGVHKFFSKIEALQKKGLPGLKVINDKLMTLPDYKKRLSEVSKDSSKFVGIQGSITGKACLDALQLDISIQHEIRYIFLTKPTFAKYTEMDEVYRRLLKVIVPSHLRWEELCDLLD